MLADGTPATPAAFNLDKLGRPSAFACDDGGCAATLLSSQAGHDSAVVPIADGAPGAPHVLARTLAPQFLDAAFSFGDKVFVAWDENEHVRTRWLTSDGATASPAIDLTDAEFADPGTADGDAALLVIFRFELPYVTRIVSSAGVGPERVIVPPPTTLHTPARFAWLDRLSNAIRLRRFDAEGHALDAKPIPILGPEHSDQYVFGEVARSGDVFVVLAGSKNQFSLTRVRDTGEVIDSVPVPSAGGLACSPTECVVSESRGSGKSVDQDQVLVARFSSHAGTLSFDESKLGVGWPGSVAWDGARFLVLFRDRKDLHVARLDEDGPAIGTRPLGNEEPRALTPTADGRALIFADTLSGTGDDARLAVDRSLVLVGASSPGASTGGGSGIVAEGGGCAFAPTDAAPGERDASVIAALLLAAALRSLARRPRQEVRAFGPAAIGRREHGVTLLEPRRAEQARAQ